MELRSAKRDRDDQAVPPTLPPLVPAGGGGGGGGGGVAPAAVHMPGAGQAQAGVTAAPPNVVPPVVPNVVYMLSDTQISRIMANASSGEHFTPTTAWARAFAEQRVTAKLPAGCLNHRSPLFVKEPLCVLIAFGEQDTYFRANALKTVGTAPVDEMLARMIRAAWLRLGRTRRSVWRSAEARRLQHAKPRGRVVDGPHGASPDVRFLARGDLSNSAVRRALRSRAGLLAHRVGQEEQQEGVVAEGQLPERHCALS